jgi:hypothetical protein
MKFKVGMIISFARSYYLIETTHYLRNINVDLLEHVSDIFVE